jgi:hypothetical protein
LKKQIKNIDGQSTLSEEALEYFGAKGALSLKNEDIICDKIKCCEYTPSCQKFSPYVSAAHVQISWSVSPLKNPNI